MRLLTALEALELLINTSFKDLYFPSNRFLSLFIFDNPGSSCLLVNGEGEYAIARWVCREAERKQCNWHLIQNRRKRERDRKYRTFILKMYTVDTHF